MVNVWKPLTYYRDDHYVGLNEEHQLVMVVTKDWSGYHWEWIALVTEVGSVDNSGYVFDDGVGCDTMSMDAFIDRVKDQLGG